MAAEEPTPSKPTVIVVEVPQDDPYTVVLPNDYAVNIINHSEYHFSGHASDDETKGATETALAILRTAPHDAYWMWLNDWLREQLERTDRDFVVNWETFTLLTKCSECGEGYDEERGDGYMGQCPSCADKAVLLDHLREEHGIDERDLQDVTIDRTEGHKADHRDRDDLDHDVDDV